MKKIVLVLLFTFVVLTTFGQINIVTRKSTDGRFHVNSHVVGKTQKSLFIEVFKDDNIIGKINTSELQGESPFPFIYLFFTKDSKKLYVNSSSQTYVYDIETNKLTKLFVDEKIMMLGIDDDDGLICCPYITKNRSWELKSKPYNLSMKRVYWTNDNFFKCIDGVRYPIKGEIYTDKTSSPSKIVIKL